MISRFLIWIILTSLVVWSILLWLVPYIKRAIGDYNKAYDSLDESLNSDEELK